LVKDLSFFVSLAHASPALEAWEGVVRKNNCKRAQIIIVSLALYYYIKVF